ncbi:hypothetical protein Kpol_1033p2 [Vanderwaltozyma polyspora DSM 70294]|uniref:ATP-dependent DNA helicase RRM3 n=1 Tax=Vanderwaltozyma polyspora (strain ATCC 22028 / DSM 70294 / BCRC 21397 / CBS 2163 / NBRC 10782 / NRRL Y-8283 / UCD 57-17) TaxID=436907 RepID=A7TJ00_VANPO|nr:uncharacterized protein Kpol_1033p2 [Vanderwaltozyma polyspora DSM 70294]EDO17699.1 hypothetical protein Kpol_1033p2 [Vanderwaltozyma polyspora DSM 70294]
MKRGSGKPSNVKSSNDQKLSLKQKSIASFFNRSNRVKEEVVHEARKKEQHVVVIQDSIQETRQTIINSKTTISNRNVNSKSSMLFNSQGSFDEECDPDSEFKKLIKGQTFNNFKRSGTPTRVPLLQRSNSSTVSHTMIQDEESGTFNSITSYTSNNSSSRQLSFTRNLDLDSSDFSESQTSTQFSSSQDSTISGSNPLKRHSFHGLNLSSHKRIKPIKREKSILGGSVTSARKPTTSLVQLTKEQETVVEYIVRRRMNVFYTGSAGTGKSIILRNVIERLTQLYGKEYVAITASTGLAATTIGGVTLHRWAGIGIGTGAIDRILSRIQRKFDLLASWRNTRVLIIDEISMIDGKFLDKLEELARRIRKNNKPFGGIQLVLTGDFFQLPPVPKREINELSQFCFESKMWPTCIQKTILLTKVFRQQDNELIEILNSIRFGEIQPAMVKTIRSLNREINYEDGIRPTELYATRREVEASNSRQLQSLPGKLYEFVSIDVAPKEYMDLLDSSVMVEKVITLKEDAQVMMLRNKPESELVNGSLGKVLFFIPQKLEKKMNDLYRYMDEEAIRDMRLVSKVIGKPVYRESNEFKNELNQRPMSRLERLETMINIAVTISEKEPVFPLIRWTITTTRFHHELMLPDNFVVDLPGSNTGLQRTQLPIMLCWALSIHKSQGQTIQRLKVDLSNIFEAGQVYVALSRATSKENLQVVNFNPKRIRANEKVKTFYKKLDVVK